MCVCITLCVCRDVSLSTEATVRTGGWTITVPIRGQLYGGLASVRITVGGGLQRRFISDASVRSSLWTGPVRAPRGAAYIKDAGGNFISAGYTFWFFVR